MTVPSQSAPDAQFDQEQRPGMELDFFRIRDGCTPPEVAARSAVGGDELEVRHHSHCVVLEDVAVIHPLARTIVR